MTILADLSASLQDYLEKIFELEKKSKQVRITDIAEKMNNSKASVNQMVNKLSELDLVRHNLYGPVELTLKGRKLASQVKYKHIVLKKFLSEILVVDEKTAEKDACRIEHVISNQTMEKLTEYLNTILTGRET